MKTTSRLLLVVLAVLLFGLPTIAQPQRTPDASRILNNMYKVYSRLTSYQDEGILISTYDEPTGGRIEKMPFKTFFKRPNRFRFEWIKYGSTKSARTSMIWFNGKDAFSYWEPDRYEKEEDFRMAVAGATGITSGAASTVSRMLLPDELGEHPWQRLVKISLLGEELFEGVRCYRIQGKDSDNDPVELWVGKTDFLLRKVREESKHSEGIWIHEDIRRKIKVDQSIAEVVFNYDPPIDFTPPKDTSNLLEDLDKELDKLTDPGPVVWTEFRSEEGQFTVSMPQKPVSQASTIDTPKGRFDQKVFTATHGLLVCMAAFTNLPKQVLATYDPDKLFTEVRDEFVKEVDGKLASENSMSMDGHPGREIKVHVFRGELRVRLFLVGSRLYMLSILRMDKVFEAGDELPNKYFGSFKLNPIAKPVAVLRLKQ